MVIVLPSFAQKTIQIDSSQINNLIERLKDSLNIPGISLGIATGNKIQYINSFGYKNIETKEQLTNNSTWQICSISKQFATVACFKLIEEGKLSLQDKISKYFENLPESYGEITVYNLLSMTSGIKIISTKKDCLGRPGKMLRKRFFQIR
jgi:CubicO group peptidase (beta-lactamase class C family)